MKDRYLPKQYNDYIKKLNTRIAQEIKLKIVKYPRLNKPAIKNEIISELSGDLTGVVDLWTAAKITVWVTDQPQRYEFEDDEPYYDDRPQGYVYLRTLVSKLFAEVAVVILKEIKPYNKDFKLSFLTPQETDEFDMFQLEITGETAKTIYNDGANMEEYDPVDFISNMYAETVYEESIKELIDTVKDKFKDIMPWVRGLFSSSPVPLEQKTLKLFDTNELSRAMKASMEAIRNKDYGFKSPELRDPKSINGQAGYEANKKIYRDFLALDKARTETINGLDGSGLSASAAIKFIIQIEKPALKAVSNFKIIAKALGYKTGGGGFNEPFKEGQFDDKFTKAYITKMNNIKAQVELAELNYLN
jgi:hypothetical protein